MMRRFLRQSAAWMLKGTLALGLLGPAVLLTAQPSQTDKIIKFFQGRISQDPEDFSNYDRLGTAYLQKGRESGDLAYYELAEKALHKSLELATAEQAVSPRLHLAATLFGEHRFRESLELARQALASEPKAISGNAILGDAYLEIGDYDQAAAAYGKLRKQGDEWDRELTYLRESRLANLNFFRGEPQAAIVHMQRAVRATTETDLPKENVAWSQYTLGEYYWQTGDLKHAWAAGEAALAAYPGYHRALALEAQVRAAQARYPEAIALYKKALSAVPLPAYAVALGDIYNKIGNTSEAKKQFDLVEYIARLSALSKTVYNRELAMFYADHDRNLDQAATLTEKELEVRHDVYTWDARAWTLYKNGKAKEALAPLRRALEPGARDAMLYFHAGLIYHSNGDAAMSEKFLQQSLAINPHFHVLYATMARKTLAAIHQGKAAREQARNE